MCVNSLQRQVGILACLSAVVCNIVPELGQLSLVAETSSGVPLDRWVQQQVSAKGRVQVQ